MEKALAKINLHISVLNKREDGYHNIQSVMCPINYYDSLKIVSFEKSRYESTLELSSSGPYSSIFDSTPVEKNLIYKAFSKYMAEAGIHARIKIHVEKRIPSGAGLAGGSSDAAAMLRILNRAYGIFSRAGLLRLAQKIGADVPFCLMNKTSICEGIGEILTPLNIKLPHSVLVVFNNSHVSTKEAYEGLIKNESFAQSSAFFRRRIREAEFESFYNDFEKSVFARFPEIKKCKAFVKNFNPEYVAMTGSGSSVIGLFLNEIDCNKALNACLAEGYSAIQTEIIA